MQKIHGLTWKLDASELAFMSRGINIQCGETSITFTGAHPWNGLYDVLRELNEELARVNAGYSRNIYRLPQNHNQLCRHSDDNPPQPC